MKPHRAFPWAVGLCLLGVLTYCKRETIKPKELEMSKSLTVEILPGKSIGDVSLGAKADTLPSRVIITRRSGSLDGVRFLLNEGDIIEDAWIEDMRAFPHQVLYQGKMIPSDISIEDLERLLGKCERVPDLKGGIFYNCIVGLAFGTDFAKKTLQIRVKPILTHASE